MNIKTTIGGSFSALGVTLMGAGMLPSKNSDNIDILWWTAFVGFICTAIGSFLGHLFAADAQTLKDVQKQIAEVPAAIESSDTRFLRKAITNEQKEVNK